MATFVLVPGAGGMAWYWHRVAPLIHTAGHEAVAVDLPGFRSRGVYGRRHPRDRETKRRDTRRPVARRLYGTPRLRACARADGRVR